MAFRTYSVADTISDFLKHASSDHAAAIIESALEISGRVQGASFVFDSDKDAWPHLEVCGLGLWFEIEEFDDGSFLVIYTVEAVNRFTFRRYTTNNLESAIKRLTRRLKIFCRKDLMYRQHQMRDCERIKISWD